MRNKLCLECNSSIFGRADKKFCSVSCRSTFHNRRNRDLTAFVRNVNITLRKNRRIIETLINQKKEIVSKELLLIKGFDFRYFTSLMPTKSGKVCYFCYDRGYIPDGAGYYILIKKDILQEE